MIVNVLKWFISLNILVNIVDSDSDICHFNKLDKVFTKRLYQTADSHWYSWINIVHDNRLYVWDTLHKSVGKSVPVDTSNNILTKVRIEHPQSDCPPTDVHCMELNKIHDLVITFRHNQMTNEYSYLYQRAGLEDGPEHEINTDEMPWNQTIEGDPTVPSEFNLWPNEWITQTHPCVAYDYWNRELIYIMNPKNSSNTTQLFRLALKPNNYPLSGSNIFDVQTMNFKYEFIGLFNYKYENELKIYAITQDMRLFEIKARSLAETTLDFKQLIGCELEDNTTDWVLIIIVVVIVVIVLMGLALLILIFWKRVFVPNYYKTGTIPKESAPSVTRRTEGVNTEMTSIVTINSETGKPVRDEVQPPKGILIT